MFTQSVSYTAAFAAGLLSFLSPCVLPLIPAYFTFITGFSLEELTADDQGGRRGKVFLSTLSFVLGFSMIFILLGATASFLGSMFYKYQDAIRIFGGIIVVVFGIHISGLFRLKFLDFEKRLHINRKPVHILGTFIVGLAFGAGWSPCVGPFLGSILAIAASQDTVGTGIFLLATYSAGMAIPFLLLSVFIHLILSFVRRGTKVMKYANVTAGCLLILVGALLIADKINIVI